MYLLAISATLRRTIEMKKYLRGTGFKHTLRWVFPYFAIWVVVLVLTAPVLTIAMMYSDLVPDYLHGDIVLPRYPGAVARGGRRARNLLNRTNGGADGKAETGLRGCHARRHG